MTLKKRDSQIWGGGKKGYGKDTFEGGFPLVQNMVNVGVQSSNAVLASTSLASGVPTTVSGVAISDPDHYRALTVTGNQSGINGTVTIYGKDWADRNVHDLIVASGTATVSGVVPFKSVDRIVLPARNAVSDEISVGRSARLGLYRPIRAIADVLMVERKASGATSYTTEALPSVNAAHSTFVPVTAIVANDSFKVSYLTDVF